MFAMHLVFPFFMRQQSKKTGIEYPSSDWAFFEMSIELFSIQVPSASFDLSLKVPMFANADSSEFTVTCACLLFCCTFSEKKSRF